MYFLCIQFYNNIYIYTYVTFVTVRLNYFTQRHKLIESEFVINCDKRGHRRRNINLGCFEKSYKKKL